MDDQKIFVPISVDTLESIYATLESDLPYLTSDRSRAIQNRNAQEAIREIISEDGDPFGISEEDADSLVANLVLRLPSLGERLGIGVLDGASDGAGDDAGDDDLKEITGVGGISEAKLNTAGFTTIKSVASAKVENIVMILDLTPEKAKAIINSAKELLSPSKPQL